MKIFSFLLLLFSLISCGDKSTSKGGATGFRYEVTLIRADIDDTWIEVQGSQEWWFYQSGTFVQISQDYVEPQFYGPTQACNGKASGSFTKEDKPDTDNTSIYTLEYIANEITDVSGLCRMTSRKIEVTTQPSGKVDLLDNHRVQRLNVIQEIK